MAMSDRRDEPIPCRPATRADRAAVIATLAEAFQHEPAFSWIVPDPAARRRALLRTFGIVFDEDIKAGCLMMAPGAEAVTAWRSPAQMREGTWEAIRTRLPFLLAFGPAIGRAAAVAALIKANLPPQGCWYLHYAGCHSQHRGKGYGGAAIRAGLALADAQGGAAWLETADEANLAIYRALGFAVERTWQVPGGPMFWGMLRPPQSAEQ
jgi:ribosomal protein S18 acetylase RimI-like enzyme